MKRLEREVKQKSKQLVEEEKAKEALNSVCISENMGKQLLEEKVKELEVSI